MSGSKMTIREADVNDVVALTALVNELGYPATENEVLLRFENIFSLKGFKTLLAVIDDGQAAGMIGMQENYGYEHSAKHIRVLALVVSKKFRHQGIGQALMLEAEKWAEQLNAYMIVLTSGIRDEREAAYAFYQRMGYQIKSSGFVKMMK